MYFIATNEKNGKTYRIDAVTSYDARQWVINHCDLSLNWTIEESLFQNPSDSLDLQMPAHKAKHFETKTYKTGF